MSVYIDASVLVAAIPNEPRSQAGRDWWKRAAKPAVVSDFDRSCWRVRLPNLQPSKTAISLRRPVRLLDEIKIAANRRDVPYQSLIEMWLSEKVG